MTVPQGLDGKADAVTNYKTVVYDETIKEIGVIADTHIPTRGRFISPRIFSLFDGVQLILHAGDLVDEKVLDELRALAPVEAVAGNMDPRHLHRQLGRLKLIKIGRVAVGLLHGDVGGRYVDFGAVANLFKPARPQVIVFGHLHEALNRVVDDILYFNPGSALDPRRTPLPSCGRLYLSGDSVRGEIFFLE